jgi:hypothetical protein
LACQTALLLFGLSPNRSGLFLLALAFFFSKTFSCSLVNAYVLFIFFLRQGGRCRKGKAMFVHLFSFASGLGG